jgi:hypothetical protein
MISLLLSAGPFSPARQAEAEGGTAMALKFSSTAFTPGGQIPRKHTCDGADVSPALEWADPPEKTRSFALIVDDPDAPVGIWVHWVIWDIPAAERGLPEGVEKKEELPGGARQGRNDFKRIGYGGPCPPRGPDHRYFFKLYALDMKLNLKAGATKAELEAAMQGHVLEKVELMGKYHR